MTATEAMETLITLPTAAARSEVPLDRLRTLARKRERELLDAGLLVRAGRHRLVRADRLGELAALVTGGGR